MASVVPVDELFETHGSGFLERMWIEKNQAIEEAEHDILPCVWIGKHYFEDDATMGYVEDCDGIFEKMSDEEYDELDPGDYQKLICGQRIWDSEPTDEEINNTPWKEKKQ